MRIAGMMQESLQDGKGCNLVVFTQGCHIRCPHCQNPETHDPEGGYEASIESILAHVTECTTGITVSGGEPTEQPQALNELLVKAKEMGLTTTMYTGHMLGDLIGTELIVEIVNNLDYMKVGPYVESLRDTSQGMVGSTNQLFGKVIKDKDGWYGVMRVD